MNWFDNVSSDSDQPIAPARLMQRALATSCPYGDLMLCRVVVDAAEPAWWLPRSWTMAVEDLDSSDLEDLTQAMQAEDAFLRPQAWGFSPCAMLPDWVAPHSAKARLRSSNAFGAA